GGEEEVLPRAGLRVDLQAEHVGDEVGDVGLDADEGGVVGGGEDQRRRPRAAEADGELAVLGDPVRHLGGDRVHLLGADAVLLRAQVDLLAADDGGGGGRGGGEVGFGGAGRGQ